MLLGDVGAGKSSLVLRFVKDQFVEFQVGGGSFFNGLPCRVVVIDFDILLCCRNQP